MKKKILVVCPYERDKRELGFVHVRGDYDIVFHETDQFVNRIAHNGIQDAFDVCSDPFHTVSDILNVAEHENVSGIMSSDDYPGSILSNIAAYEFGVPGVHPAIITQLQHKYYSRCLQQQYVPEATPYYTLLDPQRFKVNSCDIVFPVFVKPVKSFFSLFADTAYNVHDIKHFVHTSRVPSNFLHTLDWSLHKYAACDLKSDYLLAEGLLSGHQVTLEGYVVDNHVGLVGIVDSIMFPGTISFERFVYPSRLPDHVQKRMYDIVCRLMHGVQFNNSFFNVEMMYNPMTNAIHIIEVNTRMAAQFADLYEKVDGTNSYTYALDVAIGKKPEPTVQKGKYAIAASLVLRIFEDRYIRRMPTPADIEKLYILFPDVRVEAYGAEGKKLSEAFQDGKSFRYGLIHLGARDEQELNEKYAQAKDILGFEFA
ncbi:MAG TPA: ATP-grasp domain-containing protein [Candidatus Dependentiae bacterium]|nr:ATP-grasp domain-containing protein [Candidatus Dependentiae bacterium]HRQ62643.1 ATP-grasp domain-containing protein [Candidatus Dependentiae bacterium]